MIRAAFIGCGAIAIEHLRALFELGGIEIRACFDTDRERAQTFAAMSGSRIASSVSELLALHDVDAVYICTHHDSHRDLALSACAARKHIMMEKPMAITLEDCRTIVEAVRRSGVMMMTAFKLQYYPAVEQVRTFINRPIVATGHVMDDRWPDDYWAQDPVRGGGNVLSQGVHAMDLLCYLFDDDPDTVYAEGGAYTHPHSNVIDTVVATIRFTRGGVASLTISDAGATPFTSKFSFQVADGTRTAHIHNRLRTAHLFDGSETTVIHHERELGVINENREFVDALATGRPPRTTERDGMRATAMVLAAFESILAQKPSVTRNLLQTL